MNWWVWQEYHQYVPAGLAGFDEGLPPPDGDERAATGESTSMMMCSTKHPPARQVVRGNRAPAGGCGVEEEARNGDGSNDGGVDDDETLVEPSPPSESLGGRKGQFAGPEKGGSLATLLGGTARAVINNEAGTSSKMCRPHPHKCHSFFANDSKHFPLRFIGCSRHPEPFRGHEDKIEGSAIAVWIRVSARGARIPNRYKDG